MNSIHILSPYKHCNQWVFDDPHKDLCKEPFVCGADTLLDVLTSNAKSCKLIFSSVPFPTATDVIENISQGFDGQEGTFYKHLQTGRELWLCPALLKYFSKPPQKIYLQVK